MAVNEEILLDVKVQDQNALANIAKLTTANEQLKGQLNDLKKAYKDGTDATEENIKMQAVLEAQIKENTNGIRENSKEIKTNAASVASAEDSINGMRARISDLTSAYNSLSKQAREGDAGKAIQAEMLELNDSVVEASKSVGNFKENVGRYPAAMEGIVGANSKAGKAMGALGISSDMSMKQMKKSVVEGAKSAGAALKALAMNPVVLTFAAIVAVATLLYKAFQRNEESGAKLNKIMGQLSGIFNTLLAALEPVADFLVKYIIFYFETLGKVAGFAIGIVSKGLKALGFDESAKSIDNWSNSLKKGAKAGEDLAAMEFKLQQAQRESRKIQLEYQRLAEKQRQIRDDESKTIEERIAANTRLGDILKKQAQDELRIAEMGAEVVRKRIQLNGKTKENLDELAEKETEIIDIKERITGQESEQLANANSLRKEALEKRQALIEKQAEKEIKTAENLLTIKKQQQKELNETLLVDPAYFQERLKQLESNAEDEKKIEGIKLKYKKISAQEYKIAIANIEKEVAENKVELQKKQAEEFVKLLDYELQLNKVKNQQFLIDNKLNDRQLHENRLSEIEAADKETREKLKLQKEAGIVDETEYNRQIVLLNAEKNLAISEENKAFDEAEAERHLQAQADNYANELELLNENSTRAIEIKKAQLDEQMRIEKASAEKNGANILLIEKKYAKLKDAVDKQAAAARLEKEKTIADGVASLFTQTTVAGKIAASASTAIETYKGAQAALASMAGAGPVGWALGAVEAAVIIANGVKTIANINGIGVGSTASVSSSTADATSSASSAASAASSTIYTNLPTLSSMYSSNASQNETSQVIAESTPAPVVRVSEINEVQNTVKVKENSKY